MVRQPGNTAGGVARVLRLTEAAVRRRGKQAERDQGIRADGLTTVQRAELGQLRKDLREEHDILKRGSGFLRSGHAASQYRLGETEKREGGIVAKACELREVSRSALYDWHQHRPSARQLADDQLGERIQAIFDDSGGTYGWPWANRELGPQGVDAGRTQVARIVREKGRFGRRKSRTTLAESEAGRRDSTARAHAAPQTPRWSLSPGCDAVHAERVPGLRRRQPAMGSQCATDTSRLLREKARRLPGLGSS